MGTVLGVHSLAISLLAGVKVGQSPAVTVEWWQVVELVVVDVR